MLLLLKNSIKRVRDNFKLQNYARYKFLPKTNHALKYFRTSKRLILSLMLGFAISVKYPIYVNTVLTMVQMSHDQEQSSRTKLIVFFAAPDSNSN